MLSKLSFARVQLGRWARKTGAMQLQSDVYDPGYDQMHWSVFPPGKEREEAIKQHNLKLDAEQAARKSNSHLRGRP